MSRPRVDLIASAGFLYARERVWAAIRELAARPRARAEDRGTFVSSDIEFTTKLGAESIKKVLGGLISAGYLAPANGNGERKEKNVHGQLRAVKLRLVRDVGVEAPRINERGKPIRAGLVQDNLWRAMRAVREWTVAEIAAIASTGEVKVSREHAQRYASFLRRAGYLVRRGKRGRETYRLLPTRNTGPRPPVLQGEGAVFDVNLGKVVWQP